MIEHHNADEMSELIESIMQAGFNLKFRCAFDIGLNNERYVYEVIGNPDSKQHLLPTISKQN